MRFVAVLLGIVAALAGAVVSAITIGETGAIVVFLLLVGTSVLAAVAGSRAFLTRFLAAAGVLVVGSIAFVAWQAALIMGAFSTTDGTAAPADPAALASAQVAIASALVMPGPFTLFLEDREIEAVIQEGLSDDSPIERVAVATVEGSDGESGSLHMVVHFKSGSVTADVIATVEVADGSAEVILERMSMGLVTVPASLRDEFSGSLDDLNAVLGGDGAFVERVTVGDGVVVVEGYRP
ncbi:MAG TPA: hypothetical protein VMM81_05665 [Acidimicrobiia bacterium]|nr:hypothetical protein [Acidimicrobiia bacterium]